VHWLKRMRLLDWLGRADHRRRMNEVEAALRKAGDRGRTKEELVAGHRVLAEESEDRPSEAPGEGAIAEPAVAEQALTKARPRVGLGRRVPPEELRQRLRGVVIRERLGNGARLK